MLRKKTQEFIDDAKKIHNNKYDYSNLIYTNIKTKITITCKKHGNFLQNPNAHLSGIGCSKCSGKYSPTTEEWVEKAKKVHGDKYDYSISIYVNTKTKIMIICKKHGNFTQLPRHHLNGVNCSKCSGTYSPTTKEWVERAKKVHGYKYDYSNTKYKNHNIHVIIICKEHGKFQQKPSIHLRGHGCQRCSKTHSYSTEEWIKKAKKIHGNKYIYSKAKYEKANIGVVIICKKHGEFIQKASNHILGQGCGKCNKTYKYNTEEWIERAKEIHGNKYKYSKTEYKKNKDKIIISCKEHGDFYQTPSGHLNGHGCPRCSKTYNYTTEEWIEKVTKMHGNKYDYSNVKYKNSKTKITIICKEHGKFKQMASSHLLGKGCTKCAGCYSYTTKEWVEKAKQFNCDKYDYSKITYINAKNKINIICKKHGLFKATPNNFMNGQKCPKCNMCPKCQLWKTYGKLCQYCKPKNKNKLYQKTKEMVVVRYLRYQLPDNEFIHNKSIGKDCTDGHLFPDIRFDCGHYQLIVEVDEHKHRGSSYKCEKQRMYDIISKLGMPCIFIRYNPDNKKSDKDVLLEKIIENFDLTNEVWDDYGFKVEYLFY